jgi:putative sugar O-methyltransferase
MKLKSTIASFTAFFMENLLSLVGKNFSKEVLANMQLSNISKKNNLRNFKLVTPNTINDYPEDDVIVSRITAAYKKAKEAQCNADPVYLPSSLWKKQLDKAYSSLKKSKEEVGYFLRNFGSWPEYTGIEHSTLIDELSTSFISRKKLYQMFDNLLNFWELHEKEKRSLDSISYPRHGNQSGIEIDGTFIGIGSVPNDMRASVLANLVRDIKRPVIAEVGGGYGKLFYFISKKIENFCYVDLDLPETVSLASYYLMKTFPKKKFLLFGEGDLSNDAINNYDFILMPSFCIDVLPSNSVDMFINANSFGEMSLDTTKKFIQNIERTTKNWFWHMNHEFVRNKFSDGSESLINSEYNPSEKSFKLISRYMDVGHAIYQGGFDCENDIYCYIYKRANSL